MSRKFLLVLIISIHGIFRLSGISFHDLNLSGDQLLFKVEFETQQALFISRLGDMSLQQLTAFPEKLELVDNGKTILALSRFGAVKIPASGGLPSALPGYPSFAAGNIPLKGRVDEFAASADGRWILYIEPVSPAYGNLFLADITTGEKTKISEKIELPSEDFPARWKPDSRLFVYSKGGRLFYFPIISDFSAIADERFRQIGPGRITAVLWGQRGDFFYFSGNTLYRVIHPELFTRTIYGDFLSIGTVAASIPFEFDSSFDRFWIAPDSGSILVSKSGKNLFYFQLGETQYNISPLPHINIPQGAGKTSVLWSSSALSTGAITIISFTQKEPIVWRFEINGKQVRTLTSANIPISPDGALSPDGTRAVFWGDGGLELWDYANWRLIQKLRSEKVYSCAWINNSEFIAGNGSYIEGINISTPGYTGRKICLSGVNESGFEESSRTPSRILARTGTEWFASDGINSWIPVTNPRMKNVSLAAERYRVFSEPQSAGLFKNIPMIRNTSSYGTVSLVSGHAQNSAFSQERQERQMKIALCFDLYDDDSGLSHVLNALDRFNIKATFFMNGDFVRRNPSAAAAITEAGHEAASLFYAPIDFSDSRYAVSAEFITQGLARNEDEFFRATGKELSLLWHPPFYRSSSAINAAAASSGYTTVTRDIDTGDWLSRDDALKFNILQYNASEMIEQIIKSKKNGAVIPIRLGLLSGGREEYLYQRIETLLDALIRSGCSIVPVSSVIVR